MVTVSYEFPSDIEALIQVHMASGIYRSHDELFRVALEHLSEEQDDVRAIQQSIDELEAGDPGIPLDDAFSQLRARHGIPSEA
jgi:Arc/MetJ-type ribon-helix-helix transcriptional regulator